MPAAIARIAGNSISINSVKSDIWQILRLLNSIFGGSLTFHIHPCLLVENMAFAAGPDGEGHVKTWGTTIYIFRLHQRIGDYVLCACKKVG
jgi:hypothetical protein